ncbi:hypothetical protein AGMMS50229_13510 [Campylobacterota bacterium]|nr:hypothetical protein AGMMS50229_13510 [Campylobacterota bacterium]
MTIELRELRVEALIGVEEFERQRPQVLSIDCDVEYDYKGGKHIDYVAVRELIGYELKNGKFGLLEDALSAIANKLLQINTAISSVRLSICKIHLLPDTRVSIVVLRLSNN